MAETSVVPVVVSAEVKPSSSPGLAKLAGLLGDTSALEIKQRFNKRGAVEACTGGCYEAANVYDIFNAENKEVGRIMYAKETGSCCERQCCAPFHSTVVKIHNTTTEEVMLSVERRGFCRAFARANTACRVAAPATRASATMV